MQDEHIPEVMATGWFESYQFFQQLEPGDLLEKVTYNIRYSCNSIDSLHSYWKLQAPELQAKHSQRYSGKFEANRSVWQDAIIAQPDIAQ